MKVKKGDFVQILSGKDKGKTGRILKALPKKNRVIVEGVNYVFKHMKKNQKNAQGGRIQKEATLDASKVALVQDDAARAEEKKKEEKK